jgi:heme/copper-type cytochrome/quinol oxidase subunit 2
MGNINWRRVISVVGIVGGLMIVSLLIVKLLYMEKIRRLEEATKKLEESKLPGGIRVEDLKKIPVPEPGQTFKQGIAVPKESVSSAPRAKSKLRVFEIKGENGIISPVNFRVYQNDIINIKLSAIDKDYDFRLEGYNLETKVEKGETKTIEFQALNPGSYNFYCSLCSTKKEPAGKVIVVPK